MALKFLFEADDITVSLPSDDNFATPNSNINMLMGPSANPVSSAENRVRFRATGFASSGFGETVLYTVRTRATFRHTMTQSGRLTTSAHFIPRGSYSLVARARPFWEIWNPPISVARCLMSIRMDTRVRRPGLSDDLLPTTKSPWEKLFDDSITAYNVTTTRSAFVAAELFDHVHVQNFDLNVVPGDQVRIRARYIFQALVTNRAEFETKFSSTGHGLNAPAAVIRTS